MGRVIVFVMKGCGACADFLPRIRKLARAQGVKLEVHDIISSKQSEALARKVGIEATPTTIIATRRGTFQQVGAVDDGAIGRMLQAARSA